MHRMSKKHIIACWLLVVYLVTAVGPACASLTCRCALMHGRTEAVCCAHHGHAHHAHGHACGHPHDTAGISELAARPAAVCAACDVPEHASCCAACEAPVWEAPCCGDRHSTEIALYTSGDDDRTDKLLLPVSAALLPDDLPVAAPALAGAARRFCLRTQHLCHGSVRCTGLRAPPLLG